MESRDDGIRNYLVKAKEALKRHPYIATVQEKQRALELIQLALDLLECPFEPD